MIAVNLFLIISNYGCIVRKNMMKLVIFFTPVCWRSLYSPVASKKQSGFCRFIFRLRHTTDGDETDGLDNKHVFKYMHLRRPWNDRVERASNKWRNMFEKKKNLKTCFIPNEQNGCRRRQIVWIKYFNLPRKCYNCVHNSRTIMTVLKLFLSSHFPPSTSHLAALFRIPTYTLKVPQSLD